jgi:hypothetical protein
MATTQDLLGVRTATSYQYSNNLGAEEPDVNSWDARSGERGKQFHGCFEIKFGCGAFHHNRRESSRTEFTSFSFVVQI